MTPPEAGSLWRHRTRGSVVRIDHVEDDFVHFTVHLNIYGRAPAHVRGSSCPSPSWERYYAPYDPPSVEAQR